jgi:hypothetical protein
MISSTKKAGEAYAVTGYAEDRMLDDFLQTRTRHIEVKSEPGYDDVVAVIDDDQVDHVRTGRNSSGHTLVQVVLKANASVRTVVRGLATPNGVKQLNDPMLQQRQQSLFAKVIQIG